MGLSRTVSDINSDFSRKSQKITSRVFCDPADGVPLELGIGARRKKTRIMGLPDGPKSFKIGLAVLIQNRRVTDRQTDRQTDRHISTEKTAPAERGAGKTVISSI